MDGEYVVYYDSQSEMDIKKTPCTTLIQMILMWDTIGQKKRLKVNTFNQRRSILYVCVEKVVPKQKLELCVNMAGMKVFLPHALEGVIVVLGPIATTFSSPYGLLLLHPDSPFEAQSVGPFISCLSNTLNAFL